MEQSLRLERHLDGKRVEGIWLPAGRRDELHHCLHGLPWLQGRRLLEPPVSQGHHGTAVTAITPSDLAIMASRREEEQVLAQACISTWAGPTLHEHLPSLALLHMLDAMLRAGRAAWCQHGWLIGSTRRA